MDFKNITKIIEIFEASKVSEMEVEAADLKIRLVRNSTPVQSHQPPLFNYQELPAIQPEVQSDTIIKSPLVGTFYQANSPTAKPYVSIGQSVKVGDILFIVEAMKVLNEVKSTVNGVVSDILVKDGDLLQFDQPVLTIKEPA